MQNDQSLGYRVVEEVLALRLPATHALSQHTEARAGAVQWHAAAAGSAVELAINITLPAGAGAACHAGLVVRATADGREQTTVGGPGP